MSCLLCDGITRELGSVDFNRACDQPGVKHPPPAGRGVAYEMCFECGLFFAPEMCMWPRERFASEVYNEGYLDVDPEYTGARAERNAEWLDGIFGKQHVTHLDYGGGNGHLAQCLRDRGWDSTSFDPLVACAPPQRTFQLITAFEVFEHSPSPRALMSDLLACSDRETVVAFSTAVSDGQQDLLHWWYTAPRNGHVVMYTRRALRKLLSTGGFRLFSLNDGMHLALRSAPSWFDSISGEL
jgi:hypothetical protein